MTYDGAWFGQRSYGSRYLPISWQGWLATFLYTIGVMACFFLPALWDLPHAEAIAFLCFALLTIPFGYVCARKSRSGERRG
jgi:hypothetical protein